MTRHLLIIATTILTTFNSFGQCSMTFNTTNVNICFGDCIASVTANPTGTSPFTYAWSTGDTTQSISGLCAGVYTLTLTDSLGCTATGSLIISEPPQLIATTTIISNPSAPTACDAELTFSATGGTIPYAYQWYDCANDSLIWWPTMPPPPWYFCEGEWGIIVVDGNGCSDTSCVTVTYPTSAIQTFTNQDALTYQLIDGAIIFSKPIKDIRIVDALGRLVLYLTDEQVTQVNLLDLPTGLYILTAKTTKEQELVSFSFFRSSQK